MDLYFYFFKIDKIIEKDKKLREEKMIMHGEVHALPFINYFH